MTAEGTASTGLFRSRAQRVPSSASASGGGYLLQFAGSPDAGSGQIEGADRPERPDGATQPGARPLLTAEDIFRPGRNPGQAQEPVGLTRTQPTRLLPPGQRTRW